MPVCVEVGIHSDRELEQMVDEDIASFDNFFQGLGNDPLTFFEKAIIKTYLFYKTHDKSTDKQASVHGETNGE